MEFKVLGTMSPYATKNTNCPGFLITDGDYKIMLDCGSGTHRMLNYPDDLENLHVIISHLHRDHYNDVYNLQYSSFVYHNQRRIEMSISISLPQTPIRQYEDVVGEELAFAVYNTINEESTLHVGDMIVSFCKTSHPIETYAIKVTNGKNTIVYTADTSYLAKDKLVEFAKGADLLICESSLLKSYGFPEINSHLTAEQAGIIAREAGVANLMLTHFWPEENTAKFVDEAYETFHKGTVFPAKEGESFKFEESYDLFD